MEALKYFKVLTQKRVVFVASADVQTFIDVCGVLGVLVYGGAIETAGQWFYI